MQPVNTHYLKQETRAKGCKTPINKAIVARLKGAINIKPERGSLLNQLFKK